MFQTPFFIVGIQNGEQIFLHGQRVIAQAAIIVQTQLRVLPFGKLSSAFAFLFHQMGGVTVQWMFPAHRCKQGQMHRQRGKPFFTAQQMGRTHQMVIHYMGKMISRQPCRFQNHKIHIVGWQHQRTANTVHQSDCFAILHHSLKAQNPWFSLCQIFFNLLHSQKPVSGPFSIITGLLLLRFLLITNLCQIFFCAEAGIGQAFFHQFSGIYLIELFARALAVGPIGSLFPINQCALVKIHAKIF